MQPIAILFGAAFTVVVCLSLGTILLRDTCQDPGVRYVVGAAILSTGVFALCAAGVAYPAAFLFLGGTALAGVWSWGKRPALFPVRWWFLFAPYLALYLANAMAPEISYDGSRYHLGLVARYLREHGFHRILDNLYAALSQGVEMLYLFAFAFGRHSAAALVHLGFLVALVWQMISWARRAGCPLAGICAAFLVFASPVVGVDATSAYNDVAVAAITFTLFDLLAAWDRQRSMRLLAAIGLTAGFAYAAKYTAFLALPWALGLVAWRSRRVRAVAVVAGCAALVAGPWILKNWLWYRNPAAPFFNQWFPNSLVSHSFESEYLHTFETYGLSSRWQLPMQVTVHGSLSGLLGPIFLLAPIAILAARRPEGRRLLLAAVVFGATYFLNVSARFLIPALPFVALAMCMVLAEWPRAAIALVVVHAVLSWPTVVRLYCRNDAWHLAKVPYREALRIKPEEGYLESNLPYYGAVRMIERATPESAVVFTQTPVPEAYTSRKVLTGYQSSANIAAREVLWRSFDGPEGERRQAALELKRRGIDYLLMFDGEFGAELLRERPEDWDIRPVAEYKGARLYQLP